MEYIKGTENFTPENKWRGVNINKLCQKDNSYLYPPVKHCASHTVAVELPIIAGITPKPFKKNSDETWTKNHVHLPFSQKSLIQLEENNVRKRWEVIQEALLRPITNSKELEEVICSYSNKKWKFPALHYLFNRELEEEETDIFFRQLLPQITRLALRLPSLLQCGLPLLRAHSNHSITLSQVQVASLLANAFLCTYPRRNSSQAESQYANFPCINFSRLYQAQSSCVSEKLKCLINYFSRVTAKEPTGVVTYSRRYIPPGQLPQWSESKHRLPELFISSEGMIENQTGLLQVDFANKFVGGGVLGYGGVQEEIRFVICPELIAAQLFTECLDSTEALVVSGVERYNDYEGYAGSFTWVGSYQDSTPRDCYGRRRCTVLAIDAANVARNPKAQYSLRSIERELNKAYVGFSWGLEDSSRSGNTVATGNWGCGAFKGDVQLKALLQLMSAAQASASVAYFTFGNTELTQAIYNMYLLLKQYKVTVGTLHELLGRYEAYVRDGSYERITLYDFLYNTVVVDNDALPSVTPGESLSNKSPQRRSTAYLNKRNASPDFSENSLKNSEKGNVTKNRQKSSSGLGSKTSSSFYASSMNDFNRNSSVSSISKNEDSVPSSEESRLGINASIDEMLQEAEEFEELRRKKMSRRNNINSGQSNLDADSSLNSNSSESLRQSFKEKSNCRSDRFVTVSMLNKNPIKNNVNNCVIEKTKESLLDSTEVEPEEEKRNENKSSYFMNELKPSRSERKTSPHRTCVSSKNSTIPCNISSIRSKYHSSSLNVASNSNRKVSGAPVSSSSKDFVIQIEEDESSMDRCPSPDVINSSVVADTPVKYTQDIFSEDEDSMQVDSEILEEKVPNNEVFDKKTVSKDRDKLVRNTQDMFSEDEDDVCKKSDTKNNNIKQNSRPKLSNNRINSCDNSLNVSDKHDASVNNTSASNKSTNDFPASNLSTNNTSVHKEQDEIKLFKRIQRNSWADLERSRKDMKCDELEKEIQIMDTSDELVLSGPGPHDSPKIRKTDRNNTARMKNKKITDYFSKEVRK